MATAGTIGGRGAVQKDEQSSSSSSSSSSAAFSRNSMEASNRMTADREDHGSCSPTSHHNLLLRTRSVSPVLLLSSGGTEGRGRLERPSNQSETDRQTQSSSSPRPHSDLLLGVSARSLLLFLDVLQGPIPRHESRRPQRRLPTSDIGLTVASGGLQDEGWTDWQPRTGRWERRRRREF